MDIGKLAQMGCLNIDIQINVQIKQFYYDLKTYGL